MIRNRFNVLLLLAFAGTAFQGCAHGTVSRQLDEKLSHETGVKTRKDLRVELRTLIQKAPGLAQDQRQELETLRAETLAKLQQLRERSLKLRALLIKDVVSSAYDADEVALIKKRIAETEHDRLSAFFSAVRQANMVLGRWASRDERTTSQFFDEMTSDMFEWH